MAPKRKNTETVDAGTAKKPPSAKIAVHPARTKVLNEGDVQKGPVIYW